MRSRMLLALPWTGFFFLAASCALLFPDRTAPKSTDYQVVPPSPPWHKIIASKDPNALDSMKADLAYENPETGAIISLNSLCRKYSKQPLETLTNNLVRGITNRQTLRQQKAEIAGAQALDTLFGGEVDKVYLNIRTVVVSKDDCTYDFIYVSIPKREVSNGQEFEAFLASFRTE